MYMLAERGHPRMSERIEKQIIDAFILLILKGTR